jgi:hypothetical protein
MTKKRLIEVAFPLRKTSFDSVHEKNVRHGHISTLHIWPARRPLAACRAAWCRRWGGFRLELVQEFGGALRVGGCAEYGAFVALEDG